MKRFLTAGNGREFFGLSIYGIPPSMLKGLGLLDRSRRQCRDVGAANRHWKHEYPVDSAYYHLGSRDYTDDELARYCLGGRDRIHTVTHGGREVGRWADVSAFLRDELGASEELVRWGLAHPAHDRAARAGRVAHNLTGRAWRGRSRPG